METNKPTLDFADSGFSFCPQNSWSDRLLDLQAFSVNKFEFAIWVVCFFRLDMSSDLMSLHIGDRILEVNGTPVKDQPIENIENLIRYSDTVLQVSPSVVQVFLHSLYVD